MSRAGAVVGVALALASTGACKKPDQAAPPKGAAVGSAGGSAATLAELITPSERARGEAACRDYHTQACACAAAHPDLASPPITDTCMLASAMPSALTMSLEIGGHPESSRPTAKQLQQNARDLIAKCFAGIAALPPVCATPAATGSSATTGTGSAGGSATP